jgi:hypothetical protein
VQECHRPGLWKTLTAPVNGRSCPKPCPRPTTAGRSPGEATIDRSASAWEQTSFSLRVGTTAPHTASISTNGYATGRTTPPSSPPIASGSYPEPHHVPRDCLAGVGRRPRPPRRTDGMALRSGATCHFARPLPGRLTAASRFCGDIWGCLGGDCWCGWGSRSAAAGHRGPCRGAESPRGRDQRCSCASAMCGVRAW